MRVARSIGGRGEPSKSAKVYETGREHGRDESSKCKKQLFHLLPQSVAYEIAVFLASSTSGSSDGIFTAPRVTFDTPLEYVQAQYVVRGGLTWSEFSLVEYVIDDVR
jgi:hypothetical protein